MLKEVLLDTRVGCMDEFVEYFGTYFRPRGVLDL